MTNSGGDIEMGGTRSAGNTTGSGAGPVMMSSAPSGNASSVGAATAKVEAATRTYEDFNKRYVAEMRKDFPSFSLLESLGSSTSRAKEFLDDAIRERDRAIGGG